MNIEEIFGLDEGPRRTAALVGWIQSLFDEDETPPVLVGGAAVELYTLGAYTTGDIDLVGSVTARAAHALGVAGFERHGRHWIHEPAQVFVEFPGTALDPEEEAVWLELGDQRVHIISVEDLLVDRLGAWEYWKSSVDGMNALLVWRARMEGIDAGRLESRVAQAGWKKALRSMVRFAERWASDDPPDEELDKWANQGP